MSPRTLGEHLRKRRLELGLLQREVAELLGVSVSTILNWERGKTEPSARLRTSIGGFLSREF